MDTKRMTSEGEPLERARTEFKASEKLSSEEEKIFLVSIQEPANVSEEDCDKKSCKELRQWDCELKKLTEAENSLEQNSSTCPAILPTKTHTPQSCTLT